MHGRVEKKTSNGFKLNYKVLMRQRQRNGNICHQHRQLKPKEFKQIYGTFTLTGEKQIQHNILLCLVTLFLEIKKLWQHGMKYRMIK